ncbi:sulfatase family protein [Algoriphagus sediminis]|uniref:Sulfatase n=1 Tax=Algoriphagus sediminis TaxID=3057113 RepID=A0ABT7YCN1_9BACT|nr:sulfatase [Algoriphagus sediminis]MDN3204252.1 sulfatase [Algoriphagus sediminis]
MRKVLFLIGLMALSELSFAQQKPNIIILFADDMGYGDVGVNGHPTIQTPNLDQMAMEGIRFTNFYSTSPACTASRYGLLTGRYPERSGFGWVLNPDSPRGIHPMEYTLAEFLKDEDYNTAMYGKWHLGTTKREYLPLQNGFDEYIGLPYSNDMIPPKWPDIPLLSGNDTLELNPDQTKLTQLYTEKAIDFIKKNEDNPFFIYLPYAMPHVPLYPGERFQGKSRRGLYGDVIEEIDWSVGQILDYLRENGLAENTMVWFTSDNGPWIIKDELGGSAGLFRDGKGSTWEGGQREPAFFWWPGEIDGGDVYMEIASTKDIFPTVAGILDKELPNDRIIDGIDLSEFSLLKEQEERTFFYYGFDNTVFAVRHGRWKLHIRTNSQTGKTYFDDPLPLLFDVETDPSEQYNLAAEQPEIVRQLQILIQAHNEESAENPDFFTLEEGNEK